MSFTWSWKIEDAEQVSENPPRCCVKECKEIATKRLSYRKARGNKGDSMNAAKLFCEPHAAAVLAAREVLLDAGLGVSDVAG